MEERDGRLWLLLPGDADFPADRKGYEVSAPVKYGATRMVAEDMGLWRVVDEDGQSGE
jgi:hypothetical protein